MLLDIQALFYVKESSMLADTRTFYSRFMILIVLKPSWKT
jgi:hypothetical protein